MRKILKGSLFILFVVILFTIINNMLKPVKKTPRDRIAWFECIKINKLGSSLMFFKVENYEYPDLNDGLNALVVNPDFKKYPNHRKYMNKEGLIDTWGNFYIYRKLKDGVEILSYGSDGKVGGEGDARDFSLEYCNYK